MNYSLDEYIKFLRNSGIFDLLENHLISNLYDYVTGVEVGKPQLLASDGGHSEL